MPQFSVILVEPEYSFNVGMICRAMKNFGFFDLRIVNPKCDLKSIDAYRGAKHASEILENAKIFSTFEESVSDSGLIVGTTGVRVRYKNTIRSTIKLKDFCKNHLPKFSDRKIAIVFGREGIGLNAKEISLCDLLVHIETSRDYPILNVSHAAAIIFYTLSNIKIQKSEPAASKDEIEALQRYVKDLTTYLNLKSNIPLAWKRILYKAAINKIEAQAILNLFRIISKKIIKSD